MTKLNTVVVIDDHPVVLKGLRDLLASSDDFELAGEALTGAEGVNLVLQKKPNLVVLDLRLPDCLAPEICRRLQNELPSAKIVILTAFADRDPVDASLKAGAAGILLKDLHDVDMLQAFRDILGGCVVVDERVGGRDGRSGTTQPARNYGSLTCREYEVLRLLAQGMTSKEIAAELSLTANTVRGYAQTLITKLHASTRIQALATAKRLRLI